MAWAKTGNIRGPAGPAGGSGQTLTYAGYVPAGSSTPTITHGLGSTDIAVTVQEVATGLWTPVAWTTVTTNTITLSFAAAPTTNQYRVFVQAASSANTAMAQGVIARARRTTSPPTTTAGSAGSAQPCTYLSAPVIAGRLYRIRTPGLGAYSPAAGTIGLQYTYTTDGSTPTVTSPQLVFGQAATPGLGSRVIDIALETLYAPTTSVTFGVLLSFWAVDTSTSYGLYGSVTWPLDLLIEDIGVDPGATGTQY